jgi:PhnB protein
LQQLNKTTIVDMKVSIYLTFDGNCREAMDFYAKVFRTKISHAMTFGDHAETKDKTAPEDWNRMMHVNMTVGSDFGLMASDTHPMMHKEKFNAGNNIEITLIPDTREEADRLYAELSAGGVEGMPLQDMWWGSYHGGLTDKFGIKWMIDMASTKEEQEKWEIKAAADALRESAKVSTSMATKLESLLGECGPKKPKVTEEAA